MEWYTCTTRRVLRTVERTRRNGLGNIAPGSTTAGAMVETRGNNQVPEDVSVHPTDEDDQMDVYETRTRVTIRQKDSCRKRPESR